MPLTAMVRERELLDRALVVSVVGCGALGVASGVTLFGDGAVLRSSSFFDDGLSWAPIWLWALWTVVCGAAMILGGLIHGCASRLLVTAGALAYGSWALLWLIALQMSGAPKYPYGIYGALFFFYVLLGLTWWMAHPLREETRRALCPA